MSTRFIYIETDDPQAVATAISALGVSIAGAAVAALPATPAPAAALPAPDAAVVENAVATEKRADRTIARGQRLLKRAKASIGRITSGPAIITGKTDVSAKPAAAASGYECSKCGGDCPPDHDRRAGCPKCGAGRGCWTAKAPVRQEF